MVLTQCNPDDFAQGEIYEAADIDTLLDRLDTVENEGKLYKRVMVKVELPAQVEGYDCWAYLFIPRFSCDFVEGGDWSLSQAARERIYGGAT
jgi:gamma-glutamylcyclotransferase (GGCT)/AIG2-like uncharacterized protein YtfP